MTNPRLRMDKSKVFSTVHGERTPGDFHAGIFFYQDGLPFDSQGFYVEGKLDDSNDADGKLRELVDRRLRKLVNKQTPADADAEREEQLTAASAPSGRGGADEVNLEGWARGEDQYIFAEIRAAIKKRLGMHVKDTKNALEVLYDEKIVAETDLSDNHFQILTGAPRSAS